MSTPPEGFETAAAFVRSLTARILEEEYTNLVGKPPQLNLAPFVDVIVLALASENNPVDLAENFPEIVRAFCRRHLQIALGGSSQGLN